MTLRGTTENEVIVDGKRHHSSDRILALACESLSSTRDTLVDLNPAGILTAQEHVHFPKLAQSFYGRSPHQPEIGVVLNDLYSENLQ